MVTTAASVGAISRETMVCRRCVFSVIVHLVSSATPAAIAHERTRASRRRSSVLRRDDREATRLATSPLRIALTSARAHTVRACDDGELPPTSVGPCASQGSVVPPRAPIELVAGERRRGDSGSGCARSRVPPLPANRSTSPARPASRIVRTPGALPSSRDPLASTRHLGDASRRREPCRRAAGDGAVPRARRTARSSFRVQHAR
jgi:hypothetical protein